VIVGKSFQDEYSVVVVTPRKKKAWGGKRPGAGRPDEGRVTVCGRVNKELRGRLAQIAQAQNVSLSTLIEKLLTEGVKRCK
jgi:hypothetical protein